MSNSIDLTNKTFGRLIALNPIKRRESNGTIIWKCKCICGKIVYVNGTSLRCGVTVSCGCYMNELSRKKIKKFNNEHIGKNHPRHKHGLSRTDDYHRIYVLKKFNLTIKDYDNLLKKQNYRCAICNKKQTELTKRLAVDHDHKTGKVRGLLCPACNFTLGRIESGTMKLKIITKYLKKG